jgi:hypothetical protein
MKTTPIKAFIDVKDVSFIEALLAEMQSYAVRSFLHKQRLIAGEPKGRNGFFT